MADDFQALGTNRFLTKTPDQTDQTKGAVYTAINPAPKVGDVSRGKIGQTSQSQEDGSAPNVLTGTVITSCFIQTSALPSRAELSGNDLTLFDDTYSQNGQLIGDASRIVFTHGSAKDGDTITSGFILQKRASVDNTYDNVLELFALNNDPNLNFIFIGRMGDGEERNLALLELTVKHRSALATDRGLINGVMRLRATRDDEDPDVDNAGVTVADSGALVTNAVGVTVRVVGQGAQGGVTISHIANIGDDPRLPGLSASGEATAGIAVLDGEVDFYGPFLPTEDASFDIGSASFRVKDIYVSGTIHGGGGAGTIVASLSGTPASGATSMTFSPALSGIPTAGFYIVAFNGSGEVRSIFLTPGATTVTWGYPLQIGSGTNQVTIHLS